MDYNKVREGLADGFIKVYDAMDKFSLDTQTNIKLMDRIEHAVHSVVDVVESLDEATALAETPAEKPVEEEPVDNAEEWDKVRNALVELLAAKGDYISANAWKGFENSVAHRRNNTVADMRAMFKRNL